MGASVVNTEYMWNALLYDIKDIVEFKIAEKPLEFITNVDAELPWKLRGDLVQLRQILLSLLSNAVKYTHEGSITFTVSGRTREDGQILLSFEIADTGVGIEQEDMEKLLGNFGRIDLQGSRGIEGTGLGLAVSQHLCHVMGGEITARSVYGKGSVFTVIIPQDIANARLFKQQEKEAKVPRRGGGGRTIGFIAPEAKILVVDDSNRSRA